MKNFINPQLAKQLLDAGQISKNTYDAAIKKYKEENPPPTSAKIWKQLREKGGITEDMYKKGIEKYPEMNDDSSSNEGSGSTEG